MLLHIHGFNSSPASNTFRLLHEFFPEAKALAYSCDGCFADNLIALRQQATALYQQAVEQALRQALDGHTVGTHVTSAPAQAAALGIAPRIPLVISGSSLGGFYASQLAALLHGELTTPCHCALFNPVVCPAEALRPFLGRNTLFHSGVEWEFTPAILESYANFTDTREFAADGKGGESPKDRQGCAGGRRCSDKATCPPDYTARHENSALRRFVLLGRNDSLLNPAEARAYWQHCAQIHETDDGHSLTALDAITVATLRDWGAGA